ncbi:protein translocase subunit SecF, partial [Patescibacteria group bacterium]
MYRIIHTAKYWVSISGILVAASIIAWLVWGLNLGIDFTGGTSMELNFPDAASRPVTTEVTTALEELGISSVRVQEAGDSNLVLKMQEINNDQRQQILDQYSDQNATELSYSAIGPTLGAELKEKAIIALILVFLAIVGFVSYAFRKISKNSVPSWIFGIGAIVALVHDVLLVLGVFIILGRFFDVQIDAYFMTALLTILGFSVNDTIVVYDRIRERLKDRGKKTFKQIINESINTTMVRSINTSLTTFLVLLTLYL